MTNKEKKENADFREFDIDGNKYTVIKPTNKIRRESDAIFAKAYRKAVKDGYYLEAEIDDILKERGINIDDMEKQRDYLIEEIRQKEVFLASKKYKDDQEAKDIVWKIKELRNKLEQVGSARSELSSQTANAIAENRRFNFYGYACVLEENGDRVWESFEEFENDESELAIKAANELVILVYQMSQESITEIVSNYTENLWMKKKNMIDEDMNLIDSKGRKIDRDGRFVDDDGNFIDEKGNRIDKFGNKLDDEGNLIDLKNLIDKPKVSKKKKTSKVESEKPETEKVAQ